MFPSLVLFCPFLLLIHSSSIYQSLRKLNHLIRLILSFPLQFNVVFNFIIRLINLDPNFAQNSLVFFNELNLPKRLPVGPVYLPFHMILKYNSYSRSHIVNPKSEEPIKIGIKRINCVNPGSSRITKTNKSMGKNYPLDLTIGVN